ncbi:MAG: hypothetical protein Kow00121_23580 [Elainellaceae cyanobacterium]
MVPIISVITCTHNPRQDYLRRVLAALHSQTLTTDLWEYLLVDNASDRSLASEIGLSWHPQARHIREDKLGLTPARLRGIQEANGEILIFVDDDNVLDADYLEVALRISKDWAMLGAWGGQSRGEFEITPPDWTKPYWGILGIREFGKDQWSNLLHQWTTTPIGAGICVRKTVADKYFELVRSDPMRLNLDRKGKQLISGGDTDLAFTACDTGLGTGIFVDLKLTHLIPVGRLEEEYLVRLTENLAYSNNILDFLRGKMPRKTPWFKQKMSEYYQLWTNGKRGMRFHQAKARGIDRAIQEVSKVGSLPTH